MKNIIASIILVIFFMSFVSSTIAIKQQPEGIYNLGDVLIFQAKITNLNDIHERFIVNLICNGIETGVENGYHLLKGGEVESIEIPIPLIQDLIGRSTGTCKIKATFGEEDLELTEEFKISDKIKITTKLEKEEFSPGEIVIIEGDAIKENQKPVQGFIEVTINMGNESENIEFLETVNNGYFYVEIPLEENTKAGKYTLSINVHEKDLKDEITNKGLSSQSFNVIQVPTSLEIMFEESEVEPGTNLKLKTVLHDQTGEKINSLSIVTIKNELDEILEQREQQTDEYFEYAINYNEPSKEWKVVAISNRLSTEVTFKIKEKKDVFIQLLNQTLKITNVGNIRYNDSVVVKIGEESLIMNVNLGVDEFQEFVLTAPEGEYQVEILADGEDSIIQSVMLTGRSISVKEASEGIISAMKYPVWAFITAIFGFMIFMFFKKGYQKSLFGYIRSKKKDRNPEEEHKKRFNSLLNFKKTKEKKLIPEVPNKAELSLSIKGTKQDTNIVCFKVKNFSEVDVSKIEDTIQKIILLSEDEKVMIYENKENLFFIFAPVKTRTFKNEKNAVQFAQKIKKILFDHNKLFKQKLDFGISVNHGTIIAKPEKNILKFMSMGALMSAAKKIASLSEGEVLLDEKIKTKLATDIKTEKKEKNNVVGYLIKQVKNNEANKKFINDFIKRLGK